MSAKLVKLFERRKRRVRSAIKKRSSGRLRLCVEKTNKHISVQLIDDENSVTVVSASSKEKVLGDKLKSGGNKEAAHEVGSLVARRIKDKKLPLDNIVFDRGGYLYHGRVKALAEAARKAGLVF